MLKYLQEFKQYSREEIYEKRREKFLNIGKQTSFTDKTYWIKKDNIFDFFNKKLFKYKKILIILLVLILVGFLYLF